MDHTCHRCGAGLAEGTAFCPSCSAPQIRVQPTSPEPSFPPGTPDDIQPPATPVTIPGDTRSSQATSASMDWSQAIRAAAIAGILLGFTWLVPFSTYLFWMLACGAFGVVLYHRRNPQVEITRGMGARIGAVTGVIAFAIFAVTTSLQLILTRNSGAMRALLLEAIEKSQAANPDPRAQEMLQKLTTPEGLAIMVTFAMVLMFFLFLSLSAVGGAVGSSFFRRRDQQS